ncbi:sodium/proline symporter PutP [Clostridium beijerinckii]|jgi:sodium/proline symporter|uniref:Sodium/proline symporter n=2 Tax=Clostridium beijerinckii TaxID=1520 RepID=A0AAE2RMJ0_CLOBE|nr:sodium/proline symporter PutP [Clostridium beijerinckii]ABR33060.1 sodium/proline symporter [Clostridium beijerinckii NCIMB 8052]AIU04696.1 sodium/proline symporter [Clostridium beijerinckii ATCC 35702]MBF7807259.1 sodium/proline symporter PutP [Clostridium beijerinckii]NRT25694.1 SSS family solute:Na+ symporter [Clostridium beijerinckii]NRT66711.1 SSS family solute:Na+ symporter [Clostridium beijerinckii]
MKLWSIIAIGVYLLILLTIGYYSYKKTSNLSDYMIGGRGLGPLVTALSAGASDMSGWMLMGLPGAVYLTGISNIWIGIGLTVGAYFNYLLLAPRFRVYTEIANDSMTIPDYLENRFKDKSNILRLVSGIVILVFFILYVSSGLVAGGKLFVDTYKLTYTMGVVVTLSVVVLYTYYGGFLAVSLTDFFQGTLMFICLITVPVVAYMNIGVDPGTFVNKVKAIDPKLFDIFRGTSIASIISLLAWGLGYFGQPHIIVRFMAIKSAKELKSARRIGIGWMAIGLLGAVVSGIIGLVYFTEHNTPLTDPETVFLRLGDILFHPFITGIIFSAVLAAIMSTISSQLLVCSSSITKDFYLAFFNKEASEKQQMVIGKLAVLVIAAFATVLAYLPNKTILDIVGQAWAGFGSSFGPVLLLSLYWKRMTKWGALSGMIVGGITVLLWIVLGLSSFLYEMIPGFSLSLLSVIIVSLLTKKPDNDVSNQFNKMENILTDMK